VNYVKLDSCSSEIVDVRVLGTTGKSFWFAMSNYEGGFKVLPV
jgi:hypothetical protein